MPLRSQAAWLLLLAAFLALPGRSEVLVSEDYETGQTVGELPSGATVVLPGTPTDFISTLIIDSGSNAAGSGNGVRLWDNSTVSGAGVRLGYDLVGSAAEQLSAVRIDFSFAPLSTSSSGFYVSASVGEFGVSQSSSTKRFLDCRLYADGTIDFISSTGPDSTNNPLLASSNTLSIFVNDDDSRSISYAAPDSSTRSLGANSVAYWLNGALKLETAMEDRTTAAGTVFNSSNNIGRFSFASLSTAYGLEFAIDDLVVTALEEAARFHNLFQDHMVLQRDLAVPVWGFAAPGTSVEVLLDDAPAGSAVADANGRWTVHLAPQAHDGGLSHELKLMASGEVVQTVSDVIFGDVYLCSGQSNMEWEMDLVAGFADEYADDNNPHIRHIAIERTMSPTPLDEPVIEHAWATTNPADIPDFTGVGYLFAREIHARTGVPVGLLNSSHGGQGIRKFLNSEGVAAVPELAGYLANAEQGGVNEFAQVFNAQISPLLPFGICGFLWYQGESDRHGPIQYEEKMRALMRGWRAAWGYGDLPFYYCQLPHFFRDTDINYPETGYPLIRDGQLRALTEENSGMAVLIDVGEDDNIHPTNKLDPGFRLAQWALAGIYGANVVYSGPVPFETRVEGSQIRVIFDYAEGGLMIGIKNGTDPVEEVVGGPLECFEVAGSDRSFVPAQAVIDADTVLVSAPSVPAPRYVRYCYSAASNGTNRLYNAAGLPAAAFRSDLSFRISVYSGSGSAEPVFPGSVRSVTASLPPAGKVFDRWLGGGDAIADANSASTTVTMPERDLYLIATYRDSGEPAHTLTVNSGAGDGTAQAGGIMEIAADPAPPGQVFAGWTGDTQTLVDVQAGFTTMRMPASDATVTATYQLAGEVPPPAPLFRIEEVTANEVSMLFRDDEGWRYELERSPDLADSEWDTVLYNVKGDGFEKVLVTPANGEPRSFYRLRVK
ncbi:sialate O-acetylesterase [Haloferula sp. A504]|uniref:sialate O-acetylesterase n=1 Tax=Haloferula sp. A504 TaxID=3373601 RepID=UPI0031BE21B2|nr:hypothetical protein [Verrucomicrobiaceae bacterium E54]